jgi:hypothetical protein
MISPQRHRVHRGIFTTKTRRTQRGGLIAAKRHEKRKKKAGVTVEILKAKKASFVDLQTLEVDPVE